MSRKLSRLKVPKPVIEALARKNIRTCRDVLSKTPLELVHLTSCGYHQIRSLYNVCCQASTSSYTNALTMKQEVTEEDGNCNFLPTSLPALDRILKGGIPHKNITEVAGPAGSGKTQFCMMLTAVVVLPSQHRYVTEAVIYIDTEGAFSTQRLLEVIQLRLPNVSTKEMESMAKRVLVFSIQTCELLMRCIDSLEEHVITSGCRLIVLDSVASLMRKEFSATTQSVIDRTNFLGKIASKLKYLAEFFNIPVVTTNQITTKFANDDVRSLPAQDAEFNNRGQGHLTAALGNTWSHMVNSRLILQFQTRDVRQLLVSKSPVSPFAAVSYRIEDRGVVQVGNDAVVYEGTDPGEQRIRPRSSFLSFSDC